MVDEATDDVQLIVGKGVQEGPAIDRHGVEITLPSGEEPGEETRPIDALTTRQDPLEVCTVVHR